MKQWDVFEWQPPHWGKPHPVVVVSHPDRTSRKPQVEVVACSTERAGRHPDATEALLDKEDGMDWETICHGGMIYSVAAAELKHHRGSVSEFRRAAIVRAILAGHRWSAVF